MATQKQQITDLQRELSWKKQTIEKQVGLEENYKETIKELRDTIISLRSEVDANGHFIDEALKLRGKVEVLERLVFKENDSINYLENIAKTDSGINRHATGVGF